MVTIRDVAKLAGVSVTTVSHALNGTRRLAPETKARVEHAIEALDYRRNALAYGLRSRKSKTIGVVVSDNSNPFFTLVVRGIEDTASANGYNIILCNSDQDMEKEASCVNVLVERQIDGLMISSARRSAPHLDAVARFGIPIVFFNRYAEDIAADVILTDNTRGAREAVTHLAANGYRRIAALHGPLDVVTGQHRYEGYIDGLVEAGLSLDPGLIRQTSFTQQGGYEQTMALLDLADPPDAILALNYYTTIGALTALQERGIAIPGGMALVGFDEIEWAALVTPSLTTVAQPTYEIGTTAAAKLIEALSAGDRWTPPTASRITLLAPKLNVRESSRPRPPE